jgi:hypothetical protein
VRRFGFAIAAAGLAALVVLAGGAKAAEQDTAPCANSTLTSVRFLDLIDALAWHGNLRDVWFTESVLGATFESDPYPYAFKRLYVRTFRGLPIPITLDMYPDSTEIWFREIPACLALNDAEIAERYRGALINPQPPSGGYSSRSFRVMGGSFMGIIDAYRENETSGRPVYLVRLIENLPTGPGTIIPPFRWEIGPQAK